MQIGHPHMVVPRENLEQKLFMYFEVTKSHAEFLISR